MQKMILGKALSAAIGDCESYDLMREELAEKGFITTICGSFCLEDVESMEPHRLRTLVQEYRAWKICRLLYRVWEKEYPTGHKTPWLLSEYFHRKMHCAARGAVCDSTLTLYYHLLTLDFSMLEVFRMLGTLCGSLQAKNGAVPEEDIVAIQKLYCEYPVFLQPVEDWSSLPDSEIPSDDWELVCALREGRELQVMRLSLLNKLELLDLLGLALITHTPPTSI